MINAIMKWLTLSRFLVISFALLVLSLFASLSILELRMEEPRRALVALEMFLSGNYAVPTLNGVPYYNKPPLFNWMILGFFNLFGGFDDWIVRLPSLLGYLGMGILNFILVKTYVGKRVALLSTIFFLTAADLFFYSTAHTGEIDLFYSFLVFCQIIILFYFYDHQKFLPMFMGSYFFMAAGFLTKGMPSVAFQGITLVAMVIYHKDFRLLIRWQHLTGLAFSILLVSAYFFWYGHYQDPLPFLVQMFSESAEKSVVEKLDWGRIIKTVLTFPFFVASKMAPWSLLILIPLFRKKGFGKLPGNRLIRFYVLFVLANIIIYWLTPGVRIRYVYMFFPFLAVIIAYYAHPELTVLSGRRWFRYLLFSLLGITLIAFVAAPFLGITRNLTHLTYTTPVLLIMGIILMVYLKQFPHKWVYVVFLLLILIRFEMNLIFWPLSHEMDYNYKQFISQTIASTENKRVYFTGHKRNYSGSFSLGPLQVLNEEVAFTMPPYIRYKIPFYICKAKRSIMTYHEFPEKGLFYISDEAFFRQLEIPVTEIARSREGRHGYVLFRVRE